MLCMLTAWSVAYGAMQTPALGTSVFCMSTASHMLYSPHLDIWDSSKVKALDSTTAFLPNFCFVMFRGFEPLQDKIAIWLPAKHSICWNTAFWVSFTMLWQGRYQALTCLRLTSSWRLICWAQIRSMIPIHCGRYASSTAEWFFCLHNIVQELVNGRTSLLLTDVDAYAFKQPLAMIMSAEPLARFCALPIVIW